MLLSRWTLVAYHYICPGARCRCMEKEVEKSLYIYHDSSNGSCKKHWAYFLQFCMNVLVFRFLFYNLSYSVIILSADTFFIILPLVVMKHAFLKLTVVCVPWSHLR